MDMFCYQCSEAAKQTGCAKLGVCGKKDDTAGFQDLLVYTLKGISSAAIAGAVKAKQAAVGITETLITSEVGDFLVKGLFSTITNVNFNNGTLKDMIREGLKLREGIIKDAGLDRSTLPEPARWIPASMAEYEIKAVLVGVLSTKNEDIRSLRELIIYGLKGLAAYADHARVLGYRDPSIYHFIAEALDATSRDMSKDHLISLVLRTGETAVKAMAILDKANTETYGNPEMTKVSIGVRNSPGILISGHDLKDMEELLKQTEGTGVDIYTHGEMLPANYYPTFKKYAHLAGNYGGSWWRQDKEFDSFNGPILMTTNCLVPVRDSYRDRLFTTGLVSYPGVAHIPDRKEGDSKDFSEIINLAKRCKSPAELETGTITGGFAHHQILSLADKVVDAVKSGKIKKFVVMAGCDGRNKNRDYYTEVAESLPGDTVILTAGCAKYRYNKLNLGDIEGIPRILDAGQCNDSYSLALIALKLKEIFGLDDINKLPIVYDIAWYEQKAVTVLLALLYLGVKNIILGPVLPAFLSPGIAQFITDTFGLRPMGTVEQDLAFITAG